MAITEQYVGQPLLRKEDAKLLAGEAGFVDNMSMLGMAWMTLVRPPYVHATIDEIDTSEAAAMPGVLGVFTAGDLATEFAGPLPMVWPITEDIKIPTHFPLTGDTIRFTGDAVAVVVAETRGQAEDAAEHVMVHASALPAVLDLEEALRDETVSPPGSRHEQRGPLEPRRCGRSGRIRRRPGDRAGAVHPAAADPQPDGTARRARLREPRRRRVHVDHVDADPAHLSRRSLPRDGHPPEQAPDHRAGRRAAASAPS